jgi:RimJ/RimL family protein N-acetyltransferase
VTTQRLEWWSQLAAPAPRVQLMTGAAGWRTLHRSDRARRVGSGITAVTMGSSTLKRGSCGDPMIDFCEIGGRVISTSRVVLRPWAATDVADALSIYGSPAVAHWLEPEMSRVPDSDAMAGILQAWIDEDAAALPPVGRWAVTLSSRTQSSAVVGGAALLPFGPVGEDLQMVWQLQPTSWGKGLATEAGHALAHYAFIHGAAEVFAVVRPRNRRAATVAERVGMEWVGETDKYYARELQVYRLLRADLDAPVGGVRLTPGGEAP